ncbi:MAG: NAD-binding protein [Merdibacter sp.]
MLTGDATDRTTLNQAELNRADHLVIVTSNDNTNIMIAQRRGKLPDAADHLPLYDPQRECVYREFGIQGSVRRDFQLAIERLLADCAAIGWKTKGGY